jgi:hypothetical protein
MRKRILTPVIAAMLAVASTPTSTQATEFKCPKAMALALQAGFHRLDLPKLDKIIYRESRCRPEAVGYNKRKDGTVWSRDYGLTQINDYSWITYLRNKGIVKKSLQLLEPLSNLKAAKALFDYSKKEGLDPWHQWRTGNPNGSAGSAGRG